MSLNKTTQELTQHKKEDFRIKAEHRVQRSAFATACRRQDNADDAAEQNEPTCAQTQTGARAQAHNTETRVHNTFE